MKQNTRFKILTRDKFTCRYCGRKAPDVVLHVDHIHPVSRGGTDHESNLVTACRECNTSKSAKLIPLDVMAPRVLEPTPKREYFVAHPDRCRECGWRYARADSVIERPDEGYYAFYTCPNSSCGHSWRTYWGAQHRMTEEEAAACVNG